MPRFIRVYKDINLSEIMLINTNQIKKIIYDKSDDSHFFDIVLINDVVVLGAKAEFSYHNDYFDNLLQYLNGEINNNANAND